jgi:hypothetical protein
MKVIMKILSIFLIVVIAIFSGYQLGSADRLHHWIDSKGVSHLSKEPPPEDGKLIEIMEYSVRTDKPAKTDQGKSPRKPEKQNGDVNVKKVQETKEQPKPKIDLVTACYIYADPDEVYVYVIEYADPDRVLEKVLYQGTIPKGQKQLIESSRGKIEFSYQRSSEDRAYGDNHADCVKGNVISIP